MASYKYLDDNGLLYYHQKLTTQIASNYVAQVAGKGLSTNDYTTADMNKLAGIASGAQVNKIDSIKVNGTTQPIDPTNKYVDIYVPTTAADVDALPDSTKYGATLSLTMNSTTYVLTAQLKDQDGNNLGTAQTIDLPLESVVVGGSYDSTTKKVILTLQNGSTIEFSVADLVSGLQSEITAQNKLSADLVDDTSTSNKFVSSSEKNKLTNLPAITTIGSNLTLSSGTLSATDTTYSAMTGATSGAAGTSGLVPAPAAGDNVKYLAGDGTWKSVSAYALPIASANDLGGIKVGTNLSIDSTTGVLSATNTTYAAGTGLTLTGTTFSLTDSYVAITNAEIDTILAS